jgi:ferredoxin-NADP reductase
VRELTDRSWSGKIDLIFSVRSSSDVIFADELHFLSSRHPNLKVHITITRDAPAGWSGPRGRITADLLKRLVSEVVSRPAFVCGPDAMAADVRVVLLGLGVPSSCITLESFTPAAATPAEDNSPDVRDGLAPTVTFARSDVSARLPERKTVLDVAESIGVPIDYQCRSGICGTCRCKLLTGHVTMPVLDALTDADEAAGYILACQAHATQDITIDA